MPGIGGVGCLFWEWQMAHREHIPDQVGQIFGRNSIE